MIRLSYAVSLGLFLFALSAFGASDTFTVRTLVGDDTTAPSIPTSLTATPVATSQINLSWSSSTDDSAVSGYFIYRDDVHIATTTLTTYADVGLTPATLYSYYITAFDTFGNFSASSTVVSTTTLASSTPTTTPEETDESVTGSRRLPLELVSLEVIPTQSGATIRFETAGYVRSVLRWGTSIAYELGSSAERSFSKYHEVTIGELLPATTYRFTILGENYRGVFGTLTESSFTTLPADDRTPPGNVTGLRAHRDGDDVILTWENPHDADFDHVRVLRSERFFPTDTDDGWLVYDESGREARDRGVVHPNARLYYTVFTYDKEGNVSSGAVTSLNLDATTGAEKPIDIIDDKKNEIGLTIDDVYFYQDDVRIMPDRGTIEIQGGRHLTLAIPYDRLPEHLKTILVTITPGTDTTKELSFLLRVNAEKTAYTARLAPLGVSGYFPIRIAVFDYGTGQIGYAYGRLVSTIATYENVGDGSIVPGTLIGLISRFLAQSYVPLFIALLISLLYLSRRLMYARW